MEVLMGRSGKENDLVTFKVAAPHDFWFHAQGFAGAHVVVRNPSRLAKLPAATAREAAMLAAYHSKARGSGPVDVIMTQRRHVRKGRNQPAGQVMVRRHETLQVPPEMPFRDQGV
jgi:predicted ribosome quality control (RQC) complex YloA/Tae2 family protein